MSGSRRSHQDEVRRLREQLGRRTRELEALSEVASRIHGEDDPQEILEVALDEILSRLELDAAWILLGDRRDRELELAAHRGLAPTFLEEMRSTGLGECLCPRAFATGQPMQAHNTTECPRMPHIVLSAM